MILTQKILDLCFQKMIFHDWKQYSEKLYATVSDRIVLVVNIFIPTPKQGTANIKGSVKVKYSRDLSSSLKPAGRFGTCRLPPGVNLKSPIKSVSLIQTPN